MIYSFLKYRTHNQYTTLGLSLQAFLSCDLIYIWDSAPIWIWCDKNFHNSKVPSRISVVLHLKIIRANFSETGINSDVHLSPNVTTLRVDTDHKKCDWSAWGFDLQISHDCFFGVFKLSRMIACCNVCKNYWCSTFISINSCKISYICSVGTVELYKGSKQKETQQCKLQKSHTAFKWLVG